MLAERDINKGMKMRKIVVTLAWIKWVRITTETISPVIMLKRGETVVKNQGTKVIQTFKIVRIPKALIS